ncbi:MAG: polysaccharide biosynthesis protein, partial [Lachnospiraceae bacterium]|nr:polysaccharide biosynthesis protein [Lachnospiraceae bacterium]
MKIQHWKVIAAGLMVYDAIAIAFSYFFGLWLRFDFQYTMIDSNYIQAYAHFIPVYIIVSILFFSKMRMYRGIWRFDGFNELIRYAASSLIASIA